MVKKSLALPAILGLLLAACDAPMDTADVEPLPDGELSGSVTGGQATLVVEGGEPVAYTYVPDDGEVYTASMVTRASDGNIEIDDARVTGVQVDGDTVRGTWRLAGQSNPFEVSQ